jgi:hypothetical protein
LNSRIAARAAEPRETDSVMFNDLNGAPAVERLEQFERNEEARGIAFLRRGFSASKMPVLTALQVAPYA